MTLKIPLDSFVTSDTHISHKKIMEYQPNRKFTSLEEHDKYLIDIWNKTIPPKATVFHVGDFIFYDRDFSILEKLNGKIILIKGNHDHKINKVLETHDYLKVIYNGIPIVLCHYPIQSWDQKSHSSMHFHGHEHCRGTHMINRIDVGVDGNDSLRPYSFDELIDQRIIVNNIRTYD